MSKKIRTSRTTPPINRHGHRRREHWYSDNQVYFITARCKDRFAAFASECAKEVFWDRMGAHTTKATFTPWIVSLLPNHYHILGYARYGEAISAMMQGIHGATAKLVNDLLPQRRSPFWEDHHGHSWFDGCIRNETQCRRTYAYIQRQAVRHGVGRQDYPHTRITVDLEVGVRRALQLDAFMEGVPYRRYNG